MAQPEIILNTTGYGFSKDEANGINSDQWVYIKRFANLTYNGQDASVTAVRLHIEWNQYEPTPGNYQRAKMIAAVKALTELKPGMKFALHFPYQRAGYWNDTYFGSSDVAQTKYGALVRSEIAYTCPSIFSDYAQTRFNAFVDDVLTQIKDYYPKLLYVEMGNSPAEEYAIPFNSGSSGPDPGFFEQKALESWRTKFLPLRFPNQTVATWGNQKVNISSASQPTDGNYNSDMGRDLHRFAGWGLLKKFQGFYNIVKSHSPSIKVLYFISDFGTPQGNLSHLHNSTLPLALELADGIYTSDGTNQYDLQKKILALDVLKGTNPDKIAAIEFDPEDLGEQSSGSGINWNIPYEWMPRGYKHGADYIHLAMYYSDDAMNQLAPALALIKAQYVGRNYKAPKRAASVPINIFPTVFTDKNLFQQWNDTGGANWASTDALPKSFKMSDDGYWDNLWDSNNLLPCTFTIQAATSDDKPAAGKTTTLSVNCAGGECDDVKYTWNGEGAINKTGSSIEIQAPSANGNYVYTVKTNRDGCSAKIATTSLAVGDPLPVTLTSFTATKSEKTALLNWATTMEVNSDRFDIEHGTDGKSWETLGTVKANGETNQTLSKYSFTDAQPLNGENLYRLKMIDNDGSYAYSRIQSVIFETGNLAIIYPNPAVNKLTITADDWSKIDKVQIINLSGAVIYESDNKAGPEINVSQLTPGAYVLRLVHTSGSQETQKFVKRG
ncbi:T9SS type A sorting domain-containing protein [Dyadobacter subterraneus]|uniref:T9SS type A sorting domain-containing protein n=1 Tax=Dyadobacter subterraneus TaxID=2773304 RepID=UPI0036D36E80